MFSKLRVVLSKRLQQAIATGGLHSVSDILAAQSIPWLMMSRPMLGTVGESLRINNWPKPDHLKFKENGPDRLFAESSRIELFIDCEVEIDAPLFVTVTFFKRENSKKEYFQFKFEVRGGSNIYYVDVPIVSYIRRESRPGWGGIWYPRTGVLAEN